MGVIEPDITPDELLKAGDIERNPGPMNPDRCGNTTCTTPFRRGSNPIECNQCHKKFHRKCTGETRWAIDKITKEKKTWTCKECRNRDRTPDNNDTITEPTENAQEPDEATQEPAEEPGLCICLGPIRKGSDYLSCTSCKQHFHKQLKCSKMTRKQIDDLDRKTWTCLKCQMIEANPRPSPEDTETQYKTKNTKIEKLKILQYNIDSLLSKTEELKTLLKDEDIGIFLIQETKHIPKDKLPKIPGYTPLRRDRTQLIGNEKNRGGGLLIGIRKDIPFKEINIEI